jgi:uncharacterized protein
VVRTVILRRLLTEHARIAIAGGPRTGKTTLSESVTDRTVVHTDDYSEREWSEQPQAIIEACAADRFVVEGVQVSRALRRGLEVDAVIYLDDPQVEQTKRQQAMSKAASRIFSQWRAKNRTIPVESPDRVQSMPQKIKPIEMTLSATDEASRSITFVASTTNFVPTIEFKQDEEGRLVETKYMDAIEEWDLERFRSNPVILWGHNAFDLPIGLADELSFDGKELLIRVKFASERANPKAEQIWQAARESLVRAGSVGFDRELISEETRDGIPHRRFRASLNEFSIVTIGADKDALAEGDRSQRAHLASDGSVREEDPAETDDDRRKRLSDAGKQLATARRRVQLDADEAIRLDFGTFGKLERTHSGGIRVPARFRRTGVLKYRQPDGTVFRELVLPEELFSAESMATLRSAPVTDDHPYDVGGLLDGRTWRDKAVGNVEDPAQEADRFLGGNVVVNDQTVIDSIERSERADISAGYIRKLERKAGTWNGEPYDGIQRRIRYNHVALLPKGKGRAGSDVGLRLDATDAVCVTEEEPTMKTIRLDGQDFEVGSDAHLAKLDSMHQAALSDKDKEIERLTKENDEARAKLDAADEEKKKREKEDEERKKREEEEEEERKKRAKQRVKRALRAARIMEEDDDEKLDGLLDLDERELMLQTIKHVDPKFDKDDESDDYIRARFDSLEEPEARTDSAGSIAATVQRGQRTVQTDPVAEAKAKYAERQQKAWRNTPGNAE